MASNNSEDEYGQGMKDRQLTKQSSVQESSQMSAVSFVLIPPTPSSCPRSQPNNTHLSPSSVQVPVVLTATSAFDAETNTIEARSSMVDLSGDVDMVPGYGTRKSYSSDLDDETLYTLEKRVNFLRYALLKNGRKPTGRGLEEVNDYHERDLRKPTEDEITGLQVLGEKESKNNNV